MLDSLCSRSSKFLSLSCSCSRLSTFETLHSSEMEDEQIVRTRGVKKVEGRNGRRDRGREEGREGRRDGERKGRRWRGKEKGREGGGEAMVDRVGKEAKKAGGVIPLCN